LKLVCLAWSGFETGASGIGISHGLIIICMHYVFGVVLEWWRVLAFVTEDFIPGFFTVFFLVRDSVNTKTFNRHVCIHVLQLL